MSSNELPAELRDLFRGTDLGKAEWPDGSLSSVNDKWKLAWSLLKDSQIVWSMVNGKWTAFIQRLYPKRCKMYASHSPIHTPTAIGCHARYQPACQEQFGVRCLAQGHFDTPRVGSNWQPSDCQTTALTSWAISPQHDFFAVIKPRLNCLVSILNVWRKPGPCPIPSQQWSMVVAASCCGGVFQWQGLGDWSGLRESWIEQCTEIMKT